MAAGEDTPCASRLLHGQVIACDFLTDKAGDWSKVQAKLCFRTNGAGGAGAKLVVESLRSGNVDGLVEDAGTGGSSLADMPAGWTGSSRSVAFRACALTAPTAAPRPASPPWAPYIALEVVPGPATLCLLALGGLALLRRWAWFVSEVKGSSTSDPLEEETWNHADSRDRKFQSRLVFQQDSLNKPVVLHQSTPFLYSHVA